MLENSVQIFISTFHFILQIKKEFTNNNTSENKMNQSKDKKIITQMN